MNQTRSDARWLAGCGALFCGLAIFFSWRQLAIGPEYLPTLTALTAIGIGLFQRPRALPELGMLLLLGCALVTGAWFAGGAYFGLVPRDIFAPQPLVATLALALGGGLAIALTSWKRADEKRATRLIYALVMIGIFASGALYYQLFTVGFAEEHIVRRLLLTLLWLAGGLAL